MSPIVCGGCARPTHPVEMLSTMAGWRCLRCVEDSRVAPSKRRANA